MHSETKHLGLNVHSFRNPSTLTVSMSRRIESACANTSVLRFAFKPSPTAAAVRFTSALHRSVAEGSVYFGSSTCTPSAQDLKKIKVCIGGAAKAALGIHTSTSTTGALAFLGWQRPEVEIALRQLGLLQRALQNSPPEITGTLKEMLTADANSFPPPFVSMIRESLLKVTDVPATEGLPATRDGWIALLAEPADEQRLRFARVRAGIARNHQHPMIRNAPRFAAVAYRFTCDALKPWVRCGDGGAGPCPLCGRGANTGMHLLTACKSTAARSVMKDILRPGEGNELLDAQAEGGDYSSLNERILRDDPWLRTAGEGARSSLLISKPGNLFDALARMLRHHLAECAEDGGQFVGEFAKLVNRSGPVSTFRTTEMKWSELRTRKRQLASAYCWLGNLAGALWSHYCEHERNNGRKARGSGN